MQFYKKYTLTTFFILVFIISWGTVIIILGPEGLPVESEKVQIVGMALLLGTTGAMLILTAAIDGKSGFKLFWKRLSKWKVKGSYYAAALLTAPVTAILTLLILSIFDPRFLPKILIADNKLQLVAMGVAAGLFIAFFEESGWTGFAAPRIVGKYGVLVSGLSIGVFWGLWHLPPFWQENSFSEAFALTLLLARLFSWIVAYRIMMVWLYKRTQSLLLVIFMHMSLVVCMIAVEPPLEGKALLIYILSWTVVLWAIIVLGGINYRRKRRVES